MVQTMIIDDDLGYETRYHACHRFRTYQDVISMARKGKTPTVRDNLKCSSTPAAIVQSIEDSCAESLTLESQPSQTNDQRKVSFV